MLFAALQSTALEGVENLINAALKYDPASARDLAALDGQIILVDSTMPPLSIAMEATANGIMLHSNWKDSASITISGTLVSIASMAVNSADTMSLSGTGVNVSGDLETLRKLNTIMANLDIDWEAAWPSYWVMLPPILSVPIFATQRALEPTRPSELKPVSWMPLRTSGN